MARIVVSNVGKAYKRYPTQWSRLLEWIDPSNRPRHQAYWVLRGISFEVADGEGVGIVGHNGAGKSTLLKLITGTTQLTEGKIHIDGRVAALLELGMGFHPDFSGRQNCYMAGQLLGLNVDEITSLMPHIEEFAEIGDYINYPVRVYSSGMHMRLAFSVATAVRPDILIVDEALSVGDAYFRHKSFSRIREFQEQGTTLLVVSHDKSSIQYLCNRAILLEQGVVIKDGSPEEVMDFYNAIIAEKENKTVRVKRLGDGRAQTVSGTGEARVEAIALLNESDEAVEFINVGQRVRLKVDIRIFANLGELSFGYMIKDRLGQPVFGTNTYHLGVKLTQLRQDEKFTLVFSFLANIGPGSYSVSTALHLADSHVASNYEWRDLALVFSVVNLNHDHFIGISWIPPQVECSR